MFSTGEVLLPLHRAVIEKVFHTKVYDSYGHMERTVAITECPSGGLHINPEYGILELVDRQPSANVPARTAGGATVVTARVLGTSLHNYSMPLLRYEIGDLIELQDPQLPCTCGRAMPCVQRIIGRHEDVITAPDGRVIPSLFLLFNDVAGIALGQAVQEAADRLVVKIVRTASYTRDSEADLYRRLNRFLGPAVRVEVQYLSLDELRPRTKAKFRSVISHVPHAIGLARKPFREFTGG
jgi:phenylacetate-CoA ligase